MKSLARGITGMSVAAGMILTVMSLTYLASVARAAPQKVQHVILVSIDGLHALDLANFIKANPASTLAQLSRTAITYTDASTSKPSDSFPGLISMVTGGSPISTGVWYEGSYARSLSPAGSDCKVVGTEVVWDGSMDKKPRTFDAGGGVDPAKLPLDPSKGCTPVYPYDYLRVNTIFEVAHAAGLRTAWIDKHPTYEMVNGPSGHGVDDLFTPELTATRTSKDYKAAEAYDDIKVGALINEIHGKEHSGARSVGVPAIFGMTFQAVGQGQRQDAYFDASGAPSALLEDTISHTDKSLGEIVSALKSQGLLNSTVIVITAKHGQSPIDRSKRKIIADTIIPSLIDGMQKGLLALAYQDGDLASIWLHDESQTAAVAAMLSEPANQAKICAERILFGGSLKLYYNDPAEDKRTPDIIV
ncbi:MAG: alkaline phosphatase family protein, partial [Terriglobia bacterium]